MLRFGRFNLFREQRLLLDGDKRLRLGSRALDILIVLAERPGEVVSKDELIARVWPDTIVEEANLRVHVGALRKVLGDGQAGARYISNVPGRGYCFVAPMTRLSEPASIDGAASTEGGGQNLPAPLNRLLGRDETVARLSAQLTRRRFVTIVGPGGIGKSTVALAVAEALASTYEGGAHFIDLASLNDAGLVHTAVASALGISVVSADRASDLLAYLKGRRMLIVLDSCEHVIEAAARLAEDLQSSAIGVHIVATSREPLRAAGEWVHHLAPLEMPPPDSRLDAMQALAFPSVQLFVERAMASSDRFDLSDGDVPVVIDICRRLDGIPLAIELAAATVDLFGVKELAKRLDDRLALLTRGRRTALQRHRTLRAALDWSYEFLPAAEQRTLQHLAVFKGAFTLDAATAVMTSTDLDVKGVIDGVTNLAAKSLVSVDLSRDVVEYRLLDTTRSYALEKLLERGEIDRVARRHAVYFNDLFERAQAAWETGGQSDESPGAHGRQIDNVRAALEWAFSAGGDAAIGVSLTVAAVPLWLHFSLMEECRSNVERALSAASDADQDPRCRMRLFGALGMALLQTRGYIAEMEAAWTSALEIAERLDDTDHRLRALWGIVVSRYTGGGHEGSLAFARKFHALAASSPIPDDVLVGERLIGNSLVALGDAPGAMRHAERLLARYDPRVRRSHIIRFHYDQRPSALCLQAQAFWLVGLPDQAIAAAEQSVREAVEGDHAISLFYALVQGACPAALLTGDIPVAERFVSQLIEHSRRHAPWGIWGDVYRGLLAIQRGDLMSGLPLFRGALRAVPADRFHMRYVHFLCELADALSRAGELAAAAATIDDALGNADHREERWCLAELLRVKGEIVLRQDRANAHAEAEELFLASLETAHAQSALGWELRTAMSLARLRGEQSRMAEGERLLRSVYNRFTEGFGTVDLVRAKRLSESLRRTHE